MDSTELLEWAGAGVRLALRVAGLAVCLFGEQDGVGLGEARGAREI